MTTEGSFEIRNAEAHASICFRGFVDASTVRQARPVVEQEIPASCRNIVVDLSQVEFLDSHGVGLFVSLLKRAHRNKGRIYFAGAAGQPASVLQMVGFNGALVIYCKDMAEAQSLLSKDGGS